MQLLRHYRLKSVHHFPAFDRSAIRAILLEQAVHDSGAAGVREELAMIADQAARRGAEGDACLAAARGAHVGHFAFAQRHFLNDGSCMFIIQSPTAHREAETAKAHRG